LATAEQCSHSVKAVSPTFPPSPSRLGVGRILGGDMVRTADPNCPKGYSIPYGICSAMKAKRKEEWGHSSRRCLCSGATATHTEALLPRKCLEITY